MLMSSRIGDYDESFDIHDMGHEVCDGLVDIYTYDLTKWAGDGNNQHYIDEALVDGNFDSHTSLLQWAQYQENSEVWGALVHSLEQLYDEDE